jgi:diguanylate cyclase
MTFLGLIAWVSVCLVVAGWEPPVGVTIMRLLACTGLMGLASAVGLAVRVKNEMLEQQVLLASYMSEARTDPLTGLANRRALDEELERRIAQWQRRGTVLSLLLVDIDHFKRFNDRHGHLAGDEMLCLVARSLCDTLRKMDLVTRYGGEEFAVVLPTTNLEEAIRAAERVRQSVSESVVTFQGQELRDTVSVGIAQVTEADDALSLVGRADEALYAAKKAGRNRAYFHDGKTSRPIAMLSDPEPSAEPELSADPERRSA